jgi:hypothetical protein
VISIYGAIYTLAGIVAPLIKGFMAGFKINAVILIASGTLGLLLL